MREATMLEVLIVPQQRGARGRRREGRKEGKKKKKRKDLYIRSNIVYFVNAEKVKVSQFSTGIFMEIKPDMT